MAACDKHRADPVKGYHHCAGCEIERLRAENTALLAANKDCVDHFEAMKADLAASQAREKLLTDALEKGLSWIDAWCDTSPETGFEPVERAADAALNLPADDTALRAALAQCERETIERCAKAFSQWDREGRWAASVIRALEVKPW